jgi:cytochrome c
MKLSLIAALLASALVAGGAYAADGKELLNKSGCLACHSVDKKIVGPAYKDVAAKYKADKAAEGKLVDKVKKGGSGVWGPVPMPPNAAVKDDDVKAMVHYILSL